MFYSTDFAIEFWWLHHNSKTKTILVNGGLTTFTFGSIRFRIFNFERGSRIRHVAAFLFLDEITTQHFMLCLLVNVEITWRTGERSHEWFQPMVYSQWQSFDSFMRATYIYSVQWKRILVKILNQHLKFYSKSKKSAFWRWRMSC